MHFGGLPPHKAIDDLILVFLQAHCGQSPKQMALFFKPLIDLPDNLMFNFPILRRNAKKFWNFSICREVKNTACQKKKPRIYVLTLPLFLDYIRDGHVVAYLV
jgi:hypothetical protein